MKHFYQDGGDFYESGSGKLIASYPVVTDDYDVDGAQKAREMFMVNHGHEYQLEPLDDVREEKEKKADGFGHYC